ncbi:hypothetical protein BCD64_17955 [Nostoc sp. MBR 210]|uniref:Uncharacterized protein n=1 Tax=Nostoc spongiaeforme FACHB-130 TaxID=1357510 RepID=A0ABR8G129_9NOSO|nr:hypothetical protein [Nostoc spongiaeforme]MBD2596939.1 hypothetical protein [Nostoc spongiaeforme FACHB-130]OCQ89833.1 hypothetical protein BCD64_17955 [Nostoc sp. MBR 210]
MADIPNAVILYILNFIIEERSLAYLLVNKNGGLEGWGGKLAEYGITNLSPGIQVCEQIFFLEGLLPIDDSPLFLPLIKIAASICADVHIFPSEEGDWVLLLNSMLDEKHLSAMQQEANYSSLAQEKSDRLINKDLGSSSQNLE